MRRATLHRRAGESDPMQRIVRVAVPVPLPRLFDYRLMQDDPVAPGSRVLVGFARRRLVGVIVEVTTESAVPDAQMQDVLALLDPAPLLGDELLATLGWASRYYQHAIGEVVAAALPAALRRAKPLPRPGSDMLVLTGAGRTALADPRRRRGTRVDALLERLGAGDGDADTLDATVPGWRAAARSLRARGWLEVHQRDGAPRTSAAIAGPPLNAAQAAACAAISAASSSFMPFLLDGVTGSGKTEVYLGAILAVVARGAQALVLVPEIALTPQTVRRFRERLGFEVALLHSGLSEGERARAWLAAARGDAPVVLGTRSAVFVPLARPGLIVVDEEHDASYKQQDGFRYHARDLAVVRAKALGVPLVLGSATPSLESLANAEAGRYRHLRLAVRAGAARPPDLRIMDLRQKRVIDGLAVDSLRVIDEHLAAGGQVLVFRNRRGFAPVLFCHACGWSAQCSRCDRPLTVHRGVARLRCHHCGAEERMPTACPACSSPALGPQGVGTERLETLLADRFPNVPVVRIDRDSTRTRGGRDALLDSLDTEGARILVGTQMLAKGHDLSGLTLVVVVGVDEGLYSVDFRAGERLGQLVVQVAGRAGRAERRGSVILQTHHPQHPLLLALLEGGYPMLARRLLAERMAASLPPFGHLALVRAEARQHEQALGFLEAAAAIARESGSSVLLHGPLPAPMPRRAGFRRSQLLVEAGERPVMQAFLADWLPVVRALPLARRVRWSIDVDPIEMG